jgi:hypothetical protein
VFFNSQAKKKPNFSQIYKSREKSKTYVEGSKIIEFGGGSIFKNGGVQNYRIRGPKFSFRRGPKFFRPEPNSGRGGPKFFRGLQNRVPHKKVVSPIFLVYLPTRRF